MKKAGMVGMALILLCVFLTGCATTQSGQKDFSWYGKSGAKRAPVYDAEKKRKVVDTSESAGR